MYGLPKGFDPTGFVGRRLELVSFSANTVQFAFDGGYALTVESSLEHDPGNDRKGPSRHSVPISESGLMRLIGLMVVTARVEGRGTLFLQFEDEQTLRLFDDSEDYESYKVTHNGVEIIV